MMAVLSWLAVLASEGRGYDGLTVVDVEVGRDSSNTVRDEQSSSKQES